MDLMAFGRMVMCWKLYLTSIYTLIAADIRVTFSLHCVEWTNYLRRMVQSLHTTTWPGTEWLMLGLMRYGIAKTSEEVLEIFLTGSGKAAGTITVRMHVRVSGGMTD